MAVLDIAARHIDKAQDTTSGAEVWRIGGAKNAFEGNYSGGGKKTKIYLEGKRVQREKEERLPTTLSITYTEKRGEAAIGRHIKGGVRCSNEVRWKEKCE